jgi:flavodoxin
VKEALIVYWSKTGNTRKVANAVQRGLEEAGFQVSVKEQHEAETEDFFNYDLVCVGAPSYSWHPPEPMDKYLKTKFGKYRQEGRVKPGAPKVPGKNALVFLTYSGPHTGLDEATPAGKYMAQFFEHLGFKVVAEWYVLSEFHGNFENSTLGRMGDIRGKPTEADLQKIVEDAEQMGRKLLV